MIKTIFLKPLIVKDNEILVFRPNINNMDLDYCVSIMEILKEQFPDCNLVMIPQNTKIEAKEKEKLIKEIEQL